MWKKYQTLIFVNSHDRCRRKVSEQSENQMKVKNYIFICQKLGKLCDSLCILHNWVFSCLELYFESRFLKIPTRRQSQIHPSVKSLATPVSPYQPLCCSGVLGATTHCGGAEQGGRKISPH